MAANGGADAVDLNLAVELRELLLDGIGHGARVVIARRIGDIALAGVVKAALRVLFHAGDDLFQDALLAADLGARDEPAEVIHVQQRTDVQQAAEHAGHLRDAAAPDIERQVGGEKPVVQLKLVRLGPVAHGVDAHTLVAQVGELIHQQAVARGRAERVDDVDLALRVALAHDARGVLGRVRHARQPRGQADMQDVLALLEKRGKIIHELRDVHL